MAAQKFSFSPGWKTQVLRQGIALSLCATLLPFTQLNLLAQDGPPQQYPVQDPGDPNAQGPPPDQGSAGAYIPQSPQQLQQLVAPIALYPDSLVAQTLAAATYPQQVQDANSWMQQYGKQPPDALAAQVNTMPWDPSVKALTAFPSVLDMLARGQQWTIALGNAYYNQPADVMTAVQAMRFDAQQAGQLRSTPQLAVVDDGPSIIIQPVNPELVYVPYYNPWVVYGTPIVPFVGFYRPPPPFGFALGVGLAIGFGVGIGIGAFGHFGWGYHAWAPNWRSNTIIVNNRTYISNSTTVYNRGHFGAYNQGFDHAGPRGFAHASFNPHAPMYNGRPMGPGNRPAAAGFNRPGAGGYNRPGAAARPGAPAYRPGGAGYNRPAIGQPRRPQGRPVGIAAHREQQVDIAVLREPTTARWAVAEHARRSPRRTAERHIPLHPRLRHLLDRAAANTNGSRLSQ
jgi:hypothetical protein